MAARESDTARTSASATTSSAMIAPAPAVAAPSSESAVAAAMTLAAVGQALQDAAQLAATYGSTAAARERLEHLEREHEALSDMVAVLRTRLRTAQRATATAESDARRHKAALMSSAAEAAVAAAPSTSSAAALSAGSPAQAPLSLHFDADAFVDFLKHRFACRGDLTLLLDALVAFQTKQQQTTTTTTMGGRYQHAQSQGMEHIVLLTLEEVQTSLALSSAAPPPANGAYSATGGAHVAAASTPLASQQETYATTSNTASRLDPDALTRSSSSASAAFSAMGIAVHRHQSYYQRLSPEEEEQEIHLAAKQLLSPVTFTHVNDDDEDDDDDDEGHHDTSDSRLRQAPAPQSASALSALAPAPTASARSSSAAAIGAQSIFAPIHHSSGTSSSTSSASASEPHQPSTTTTLSSAALSASSAMAAAAAAFMRAQSSATGGDDDASKFKRILPKKPRVKKPARVAPPTVTPIAPAIASAPASTEGQSSVLLPAPNAAPLLAATTSTSPDASVPDESASTASTATAKPTPNKKRKVTTDEGLVIKQNLVWPAERRNITEMKHSSRLLELDALEELDRQTPWNEMYKRRPLYSHVINYGTLDERAKTWFVTTLKIQFVWRRELWERLHWLPMSESVCTGAAWEKYRQTRKRRAKHAVTAWRKVYAQSIQMIEAGILPDDIWCDPALWYMPANPIYWLPDSPDVARELALIDTKHAVRCYHVYDLARHPFYELGLVDKYPTKHELPSFSATTSQAMGLATDDDLVSVALNSVPLLADLAPRQSPHHPKIIITKDGSVVAGPKKRGPRGPKKTISSGGDGAVAAQRLEANGPDAAATTKTEATADAAATVADGLETPRATSAAS